MDTIEMAQYKTVDPNTGLPALTTLLYKVCDNDGDKFEEACRLLRLFMGMAQLEVRKNV